MSYFKYIKDISTTQILAKGLVLNKIINEDFLEELRSKLGENYKEIITSDIRLLLIPRMQEEPGIKQREKEVIIQLRVQDFIRFEQPSQDHYKENVVVITSNRKDNLDKVLKK